MSTDPSYPPPQPRVRFDTIGEAWRWLQQQMGPWVAAILVILFISWGFSFLTNIVFFGSPSGSSTGPDFSGIDIFWTLLAVLVQWTASATVMAGAYHMAIKQIRGGKLSPTDLFKMIHLAPRIMGASVLMGFAMAGGFILCIIPGFIVMALLMFTYPLIVDRNLGAVEALRESWNTLRGDWLNATVYYVVLGLVTFSGFLACGVGLLFTYPLFFLGICSVYRDFYMLPPDNRPMEPFAYPENPPPTEGA